jgi:hypothetical protein
MSERSPDNLWVCHRCKMIGSGHEAGRHVDSSGHPVEELTSEMTTAVRAETRRRQPHPTAADFIAFAAFRRQVEADREKAHRV